MGDRPSRSAASSRSCLSGLTTRVRRHLAVYARKALHTCRREVLLPSAALEARFGEPPKEECPSSMAEDIWNPLHLDRIRKNSTYSYVLVRESPANCQTTKEWLATPK